MMDCRRPILGDLPRPLGLWISAFAILTYLAVAVCVNAQDLAEASRQERNRKAAEQKKPKSKVYTNEDLAKPQILTPEDRIRAEAARKDPTFSPNQPPTQSVGATNESSQESLGEIARRYRKEKEVHRAEEVEKLEKPPSPSRYKMDLSKATLAAPVQRAAIIVPPVVHPEPEKFGALAAPARRDPFSRALPLAPLRFVAGANVVLRESGPIVSSPAPGSESIVTSNARTRVIIQPGDSLWKLAQQYLGCASRWHELLAANPDLADPSRIRPGSVLLIPQATITVRAKSPANILVKKGDTLWKIAEVQFGRGSHWPCLARANPQLRDFNQVEPGQILTIPATCVPAR